MCDVNFFSPSIGAGETELLRNGTGAKVLIFGRTKGNWGCIAIALWESSVIKLVLQYSFDSLLTCKFTAIFKHLS